MDLGKSFLVEQNRGIRRGFPFNRTSILTLGATTKLQHFLLPLDVTVTPYYVHVYKKEGFLGFRKGGDTIDYDD